MNKKEYVNSVMDAYENFEGHDYKKEALAELERCEAMGMKLPNARYLLEKHPDFPSIVMSCETECVSFRVYFDPREYGREGTEAFAKWFYDATEDGK